jgi:basic amino acid/polyamine antiporter, APA family
MERQNDLAADETALVQGLGFWQATAINITQIVGAGVFATIPLIMGHLPGHYALLAWLMAGLLIIVDSMIWGELGAAFPSAGGSYRFLLESYGRNKWGRLMSFLFVWQILISGPLEVGSGLVAAAQFSTSLTPDFKAFDDSHTWKSEIALGGGKTIGIVVAPSRAIGFALGLLILFLLYRRVTTLGRLSVFFLMGVLGLIAWILLEGALRFDPKLAFPESAPPKDLAGNLGVAMAFAIYSYLGYYNVCYLGAEVRNPTRTIPRSILTSACIVVVLFTLIHLAIVGVVPAAEAVQSPAKDNLPATFMKHAHGQWAATLVTVLLVGSCFASCFSGTLGYSRVPYAAARECHFFRWFDQLHPTHRIPHHGLFLIGGLMLFWSFFSLDAIIMALIVTRILEQFVAQAFAVVLLRKVGRTLPWRMWLYPLPCVIATAGWLYVYVTSDWFYISLGAATLVVGAIVFLIWANRQKQWPF